jgi:hypothetical protein
VKLVIPTIVALLYWTGIQTNPAQDSKARPDIQIAFCNFPLRSGLKQANASFNVVYSFTIDPAGKPSAIKKVRNDYVDPNDVISCIEGWRLIGIPAGSAMVTIFRWEHGEGWVALTITGPNLSETIKLTGERCPYKN